MNSALPDWLERFRARLGAEVIETHVSWVLLADGLAWKLKKPLKLPFLDYATPALRHQYCVEELRLNRRFAPDLYLGLEAVDDSGEWAVRMRRFDEGQRLDHVCARAALTPAHLSGLAQLIHAFHRSAPVAAPDGPFGSPAHVLGPALDNFHDLATLTPDEQPRLDPLASWTTAEFERHRETFAARLRDGHVRECHGDLHLGNLVLLHGQVIPFDCIEFNDALRWIDVASELAFTWMDLLDRGQPGLAAWLLNEWLSESGDFGAVPVLRFYAVYKAMVRAKVAALSRDRAGVARYLALAEHLTRPPRPRLVITHGLSGSGKTTHSSRLLMNDPRGATLRLRSDVERKRMHGLAPLTRGSAPLYTPEATRRTYARLHELAGPILDAGWSVVVDAAFLKRAERDDFHALATRHGADFAILACAAPVETLRERLQNRRNDASDATAAALEKQREWVEPLDAGEQALVLTLPAAAGAVGP